jgi:adenylate cyclase
MYSLDGLAVKKAFPRISIPEKGADPYIDFTGPAGSYLHIPFYLLFTKMAWEDDRPPLYSGGRIFKDKIVLIGPWANFMHDSHETPWGTGKYSPVYGVEIHAQAIATLLNQKWFKETSRFQTFLILVGAGLLIGIVLLTVQSPLLKLVPTLVIVICYQQFSQWTFNQYHFFIPLIPVEITILGGAISVIVLQGVIEQLKKRRISQMLHRYVSKNIADELIKSGESLETLRTPKRKVVSVLMSDVRDFTTMTEASEPGPFVQQLNEYLTEMVDCVFKNNGTNDKFVGDAVMAVFGNPTSFGIQQDAWNAVQTALEMRERLRALNERWAKIGKPPFRIGIGINHGEVMAGDIGSSQKAEFGVIGDTVNVAARVESLTKELKSDILITEPLLEWVKDRVVVEQRGDMKVKGRNQAVTIYALIGLKT